MSNLTSTESALEDARNQLVGKPLCEGVRVTVVTLGWLACVIGVFGNVLIITTLLSQQALRSVHNIYIANLALADLLVVGYTLPFWLLDLNLGYQPVANMRHCKVNSFILGVCVSVSLYTLVLISLNRYLRVRWYNAYPRLFSKSKTAMSCVVLWILCLLSLSSPLFGVSGVSYAYDPKTHLCTTFSADRVHLIAAAVSIFLCTCLIGVFTGLLLRFWKRSKTRIRQWTQTGTQNPELPPTRHALTSSDISLIRSLILVFVLSVVSGMPVGLALAADFVSDVDVSSEAYAFLLLLVFLNNSVNWIVYGVMNKSFKEGYKQLMLYCKEKVLLACRLKPVHERTDTEC